MAFWKAWTSDTTIAFLAFLVSVSGIVFSYQSCTDSKASLRMNQETLRREYLEKPNLIVSLGRDAFLNAKPYIGVMVNVHNSGAQPGVVAHGSLAFGQHQLNLVMVTTEPESWTYGPKPERTPMRFSFFAPITVEKSASISNVIWFEKDMGGVRLFTSGRHLLELRLFNDTEPQPVATKKFGLTLTDDNVSFIYGPKNALTQLPVTVTFNP